MSQWAFFPGCAITLRTALVRCMSTSLTSTCSPRIAEPKGRIRSTPQSWVSNNAGSVELPLSGTRALTACKFLNQRVSPGTVQSDCCDNTEDVVSTSQPVSFLVNVSDLIDGIAKTANAPSIWDILEVRLLMTLRPMSSPSHSSNPSGSSRSSNGSPSVQGVSASAELCECGFRNCATRSLSEKSTNTITLLGRSCKTRTSCTPVVCVSSHCLCSSASKSDHSRTAPASVNRSLGCLCRTRCFCNSVASLRLRHLAKQTQCL
mmetsp:Transcript_34116/g.66040  ORF Transcript_34116/g.66040 Transcript_34116/m.66040 type:complete len:262 (+) Transcript_34116:391-1176(+)